MEKTPMDDLILQKLESLKETLSVHAKQNEKDMRAIIVQTTKTNGRVTELERWTNRIIGGLIISQIIVVPIVIWLLIQSLGA